MDQNTALAVVFHKSRRQIKKQALQTDFFLAMEKKTLIEQAGI